MKRHQADTIRFFDRLRPGRVLDAGSGTDELATKLRAKGFEVFSLDLYSIGARGRFVKADLNQPLPFTPASFDYVLCSESMQYLENHASLMREFAAAVKPGGSVVISTPNILNGASRLYFLQRGYFPFFKPVRTVDGAKGWDAVVYHPISLVDIIALGIKNRLAIKEVATSHMKGAALIIYPFLKGLYLAGLIFEKDRAKAAYIKLLASKEALAGDHLIIRLERGTDD
ncbi:MAG: class I SAM-dependent methyltransferase [Deltaproteobacteria bacterium]|nr:class I SAM-dependent methyltransferase [Deltaproteobacteria bacterium]